MTHGECAAAYADALGKPRKTESARDYAVRIYERYQMSLDQSTPYAGFDYLSPRTKGSWIKHARELALNKHKVKLP